MPKTISPAARTEAVAVVVPARDEEATIAACLRSIERARRATQQAAPVRWWTVVVADRCRDRTVRNAVAALGDHGAVLEVEAGNVGRARRLGTAHALRHFDTVDPSALWLASTDADSHVPDTWVLEQLAHADRDVDAVAGIVAVDSYDGHPPEGRERFLTAYEVPPNRPHAHVHGANLGVHASAYLRAGGWAPVPLSEDHDLWARLGATGATCVSSASLVVTTSGRHQGRAVGGFADALRAVCAGLPLPPAGAGLLTARTAS